MKSKLTPVPWFPRRMFAAEGKGEGWKEGYAKACLEVAADIEVFEGDDQVSVMLREQARQRIHYAVGGSRLLAQRGICPAWMKGAANENPMIAAHYIVADPRRYLPVFAGYAASCAETCAVLLAAIADGKLGPVGESYISAWVRAVAWSPACAVALASGQSRVMWWALVAQWMMEFIRGERDNDVRAYVGHLLLNPEEPIACDPTRWENDAAYTYVTLTSLRDRLTLAERRQLLTALGPVPPRWAYALLRDVPEARDLETLHWSLLSSPAWTVEYVAHQTDAGANRTEAIVQWIIPSLQRAVMASEKSWVLTWLNSFGGEREQEAQGDDENKSG